jgi:titin
VLGYQVLGSSDNGATWRALASLAANALTFSTVAPSKGTAMLYKVAARNSSGFGAYAEPVRAETPLTVASKPTSVSLALAADNKVAITWRAPLEFGGTPITGYLIQKLDGAAWVDLAITSASTFTLSADRLAMGRIMNVRVIAQNAVGSSEAALSPNLLMPYGKADAPTGLSADTNLSTLRTTLSWAAPGATGGSPISSFNVQFSTDNGIVWRGLLTASAAATGISFAAPTKGVPTLYRVSANTLGGTGAASASVLVSLDKSAPSAPVSPYSKFAADGNITLIWGAPADTGGSPITAYRVETLIDSTWQPLSGNLTRAISILRGLPGQVHQLRVVAINETGESAPSSISKISVPLVKASAPTELVANTTSKAGSVVLSWKAPSYLGGAIAASNYLIEYTDNGTTWLRSYATTTTIALPAPPKGVTRSYRVSANTQAGASPVSNVVSASTAATVASAPSLSSVTFATDGTVLVKFSKPYDLGGSPLTGFVIEKQVAGVWSSAAQTDPTATSANMPREAVGVLLSVRVLATNGVGNSLPSRTLSIQMPFSQAAAVENIAIKALTTTRALISWTAPTNLGGGKVSRYTIEYSADNGATWRLYYNSYSTSYSVQAPPKGVTWLYRVSAVTQWGAGFGSVISYRG